jgi:hypothetical protein
VEINRFEGREVRRHALDQNSDAGLSARPAVLGDPVLRVAESCRYRAKVDPVGGATSDGRRRSDPELSEIPTGRVEIFGRIEATQPPREVGSVLPKSFNLLTASGDRVWIAPNATKHIWEETRGLTFGRAISQEHRLIGLADAIDNATVGNWEKMQFSRGWELIFSEPRDAGFNPVLKHARYRGGGGS